MARLGPITLTQETEGLRFDQALARACGLSRGRARAIIDAGGAYLNRRRLRRAQQVVKAGDRVHCFDDAPERAAEETPAPEVRLRDPHLAVVFKPAGLPSQATQETDRIDLLARLKGVLPKGHLLHRLDRNASGLLILGLSAKGRKGLVAALGEGRIERRYTVRVQGALPEADAGRWEHRIDGDEMRSEFRVLERGGEGGLLEVRLETGRTHQIRKQCAAEGIPVVGDRRYGGPRAGRLALHAGILRFEHPLGRGPVSLDEPLPEDFPE